MGFRIDWVPKYLGRKPKVILDIGAYDGEDSRHYKWAFPEASVYAFEPNPDNYNDLMLGKKTNNGFTCFQYAVSDYNGKADFYRSFSNLGIGESSSILKPSKKQSIDNPHINYREPIEVDVRRIDSFCEFYKITEIDLCHVDVQGSEARVFLGMGKYRPKMIYFEYGEGDHYLNSTSLYETLKILGEMGYTLVEDVGGDALVVHDWKPQ